MKFNPIKFLKKIPVFFSEVRTEMKKVTWPTRKETINKTLTVIGISLATAIVLGGLDFLFTWVLKQIIAK